MPTSKGTEARNKRWQRYLAQINRICATVETDSTAVTAVAGSSQASRSQSGVNAAATVRYAANSELIKMK